MKKIISLILALVMVMGLAVGASAASITINPGDMEDKNVVGETYTAYLLFTATSKTDITTAPDAETDKETPVAYEIEANSAFKTALDNFKNANEVDVFTFEPIVGDTNKLRVKKNADYDAADLAKALADANLLTDANKTARIESLTDGKYVFSNLPNGYYLITSSLGSKMIVDTLGSVEVTTKNVYPSLTKTADKTTAAFGEEVTYTVTVNIPATANNTIKVHDNMTDLTYVEKSASAKVEGNALSSGFSVVEAEANCCDVEFVLDQTTVIANAGKSVVITYKAKVDANKTVATNSANLTYSNFKSTDVSTTVKNYKIDVFKYTGTDENKTGLAGAGFVLKNTDGKYYKLENGIVSWVDAEADATEYKTTESAHTITFNGLANGTYTLVEKTVPAGYNKADDSDHEVADADITGEARIEVLNSTGSELPSTGGIGTTLFYVIGGLLMAGAAVLLITKKRMT